MMKSLKMCLTRSHVRTQWVPGSNLPRKLDLEIHEGIYYAGDGVTRQNKGS